LIVDRGALAALQETNDAYLAAQTLKRAFSTDVSPILAEARRRNGGAIDPVDTYRASGYRERKANERPTMKAGGGGIV
jgi:L-rhamnose isomerase/sugar isomerase